MTHLSKLEQLETFFGVQWQKNLLETSSNLREEFYIKNFGASSTEPNIIRERADAAAAGFCRRQHHGQPRVEAAKLRLERVDDARRQAVVFGLKWQETKSSFLINCGNDLIFDSILFTILGPFS